MHFQDWVTICTGTIKCNSRNVQNQPAFAMITHQMTVLVVIVAVPMDKKYFT